ncbi:hypothetical protein A9Q84_01280 [Halobacteriovorax marinus]|uniref:Lipoprotein n=1 Tax=Halobacteriovorax marinus TaxID=97084 RepID=A0A1Y5FHJ7_9BACT|nr:hypothetical protein A9Q84_01280 [Halobacteriovorax marinus]
MNRLKYIILSVLLVSCSSRRIVNVGNDSFNLGNSAKVYLTTLKNKGKKFDLGLSITTRDRGPILIKKEDFECGKGSVKGHIYKFGRRAIPNIIVTNELMKNFLIVCSVDSRVEGDYYVEFKKVYSLDTNSLSPGRLLHQDLKWIFNSKITSK